MGQQEILNLLAEKRKEGDRWFFVNEIRDELKKKGVSESSLKGAYDDLFRLACFNMVEAKGIGMLRQYKIVFRGKAK